MENVLKFYSVKELHEEVERERAFQATLLASDHRHNEMFELSEDDEWITLWWGGYAYDYDMSQIVRPEDLLWFLHHVGKKRWKHSTAKRVARLIEVVMLAKGWKPYERVPHSNEAPKPKDHVKIERAKVTPAIRYEIIRRDGYRCRACGFAVEDGAHLHIDHIIPVSAGGLTRSDNLQTLCSACNTGKGARNG